MFLFHLFPRHIYLCLKNVHRPKHVALLNAINFAFEGTYKLPLICFKHSETSSTKILNPTWFSYVPAK